MAGFGELSYKRNRFAPIGSPTEQLAQLYQQKREDFDYVVDKTNLIDTALSGLQFNEADREKVMSAKEHFRNTIEGFEAEGDLENRVLDVKNLANDLNNRFGLTAVQQDYQKRQAYIKDLKERVGKKADQGGISMRDFNRAVRHSDRVNKGVVEDSTGGFQSTFSGRAVLPKYNFSDRVAERLKGFKEGKTILTNAAGQQIVPDAGGSGYLIAGTLESVGEEELIEAAKQSLLTDPEFQDRVDEEVFYELDSLLEGEEGRRNMTAQDLINITGEKVAKDLAQRYGASSVEELEKKMKEQGASMEGIYRAVRAEQLANQNIKFGVAKESYEKYEAKYLRDWKLEASMKDTNQEQVNAVNYANLQTVMTEDVLNSDTYKQNANLANDAVQTLDQIEKEIQATKLDPGRDPDKIKRLEDEADRQRAIISNTRTNTTNLVEASGSVKDDIDKVVQGEGFTLDTGFIQPKVQGIDINQGEMYDLIGRNADGQVTEEQLTQYISIPKDDYTLNFAFETLQNAANRTSTGRVLAPGVTMEQAFARLRSEGISAVDEVFDDYTATTINRAHGHAVSNATNRLKTYIDRFSERLTEKMDDGEIVTNREVETLNLPEMSAKERRNSATAQYQHQVENLTNDPTYYKSLVNAGGDRSIIDLIEDEYDAKDEDGDILWDKGKLIPAVDSKFHLPTKSYRPVMFLSVPVRVDGDKDNQRVIKVPVHSGSGTTEQMYVESLQEIRSGMGKKIRSGQGTPRDKQIYRNATLNQFNLTEFGQNFDLLNLPQASNGEIVSTVVNRVEGRNVPAHIKVYRNNSPTDMSYYLVDSDGKFYAKDNSGKALKLTEAELRQRNDVRAIGSNSPSGIKQIIADRVFADSGNLRVNPADLVDVSYIFGQDVKDNVDTRVHKDVANKVEALKGRFPNLFLTDALRETDSIVGAGNSAHKKAMSLDLRLNEDAIRLTQMSDSEKQVYGIKKAEVHGNHVHIEFMR